MKAESSYNKPDKCTSLKGFDFSNTLFVNFRPKRYVSFATKKQLFKYGE